MNKHDAEDPSHVGLQSTSMSTHNFLIQCAGYSRLSCDCRSSCWATSAWCSYVLLFRVSGTHAHNFALGNGQWSQQDACKDLTGGMLLQWNRQRFKSAWIIMNASYTTLSINQSSIASCRFWTKQWNIKSIQTHSKTHHQTRNMAILSIKHH